MTTEPKQPDAQTPGTTAIAPQVALEEYVALAEFWRNRALLNGQRAFEQGEAINAVQEAHTALVAENEELRATAAKPKKVN